MANKRNWLLTAAILFCLTAAILSLLLGAVRLSPGELMQALLGGPNSTAGYIFWYARLPRTLACLLSGAALAVSGAVIQAVLSNRLASPGIIGVNAGAGLAVTVCCALGLLSGWTIALSAFGGAMVSVLLVVFTAEKTGASRTTVILGGVAVNAFLNALSEALTTLVPDAGVLSGDFRVGGFSSVVPVRLLPAGVLICGGLLVILTLHNDLEVLSLGEETAQSLGMSVKKIRTLFLVLSAMLAGASVSFAGLLGFVGLIVPHAVRNLTGSESRYLLPLCAVGGAGFVTACDLAARLLFIPYELPVGILMSVLGGPFFLGLLLKRKGGLEIQNLSAGYAGNPVLTDVSLTLAEAAVTVIVGPNGCGKSTFLKALAGILPADGNIRLDGQELLTLDRRELAKKVAFLPQNRTVPEITAKNLVLHGRFPYLSYPRRYREEDHRIAETAMEKMGVADLAQRSLSTLSGGQRQKVYIAMALAQDTPVVLLDEPNTFLDIAHQLQLMDQARALAAEGKTVVLVLHDLSMALDCADSLAVFGGGKCLFQGSPEKVFLSGCLDSAFKVQVQRVQTPDGWKYYFSGKSAYQF